jgi:Fe-S-cluster-containing hydrogenase component 2
MKSKRHIFFSPQACTGCCLCELSCSQIISREYNPDRALIRVLAHPDLGSYILGLYNKTCLCKDGFEACTELCSADAIRFVDETNVPKMLKDPHWFAAPLLD